ncbi:P-loop containing nucleoside triphosphate hydrolase protein [Mycena leptocephala]|nr:P-loop containing nucleoside triphosphate hydrolase protein [Mycena leptocephala]
MQRRSTRLESLIEYIGVAASAAKTVADSTRVPFLGIAATIGLSIVKSADAIRSNKEHYIQVLEQIHEIFCSIIFLSSTSETNGVLPPALLYDIAKLTENLQKIYAFMKAQQGMGKLKQLLKQADNAARLDACKSELQESLRVFQVQIGISRVKGLVEMHQDAEERHKELLELLAAHPELTDSELSSLAGTLSSLGDSTGSLSVLPPSPQIFHGRESELQEIVDLLQQESPRIAILGPGGIGKTSLGTAVLHHAQAVDEYLHRYFVPCHSTSSCSDLVSSVASHIGLDKSPNLTRKVARYLTQHPKSLLILDNFETPWEPNASRSEVEEFLSLLADVSNLAIVASTTAQNICRPLINFQITMRGAKRPAKVRWTRPFLVPLQPLTDSASLQTFIDIADGNHNEDSMRKILALTGNLPLAVTLIASVVAYEGCKTTLERWDTESTRLLSDGYDKKSSLDISIMLSFSSSRMTPEAQDLLGLLSMLPDGLSDADQVQAELPIPDVLANKSTLIRTALAYIGNDKRLKVLAPIAEHIRTIHPPSPELKYPLRQHYHKILDLWKNFDDLLPTGVVSQITNNLGNLNMVLMDALQTECPDTVANFRSVTFLDDFGYRTNRVSSPLMITLAEKIQPWRNHSVYGEYLIHVLGHSVYAPVVDSEAQIAMGTQFFEHQAELDQGTRAVLQNTFKFMFYHCVPTPCRHRVCLPP